MSLFAIIASIKKHEGFRPTVYFDSRGYDTIGYGLAIKNLSLTESEAALLLQNRVVLLVSALDNAIPWWAELSEPRQNSLVEMAYQLGVHGLLEFTKMIAALREGRWQDAKAEALRSEWAEETPTRANEIAALLGPEE